MAVVQSNMAVECETSIVFNEFKHFDEFNSLVEEVCTSVGDVRKEEMLLTKFTVIFGWYQEQPHLLDPHLTAMLGKCIALIYQNIDSPRTYHFVFKIIHLMINTRGYKCLVRLMPHTVDDLEPVLDLLKTQDLNDHDNWQTRYVLLLWLSIVIMVPFALERLEKQGKPPLSECVLNEAKKHVVLDDVTQDGAAYLLAKLISRPDVYPSKLEDLFLWAECELKDANYDSHKDQMRVSGCLRSFANICKIVPRAVLYPHASRLLNIINTLIPERINKNVLLARLRTKLIQRIGLLFCPRRAAAASWRYQRGFRSLMDNLSSIMQSQTNVLCGGDMCLSDAASSTESYLTSKTQGNEEKDDDEIIDVPDEVADVIDQLIDALRSKFTYVRWSAAKGLGRICSRLTAPFVDDVLSAILNLCTRLEPFTAWHGACFALAELGRRCLLLPEKLPEVIPVVLTALFYDEKSGDCNFGSNVRDAACYCCWAFARAYSASDFACHVHEVSRKLILSALFDRELNVRRAAAAAFQENVGRQGQFANGIEIITTVDYFAVGSISNCYLNLSKFVAGFEEYTSAVIEHLAFARLGHWDENIRDMAARALNKLTPLAVEQLQQSILPKLLHNVGSSDLYMRQGSVLGIAEVIESLSATNSLPGEIVDSIVEIFSKLEERKHFHGVAGELMRRACCRLIEKVSTSKLPLHEHPILERWRHFLDDCLIHKESSVAEPAIPAFAAFISTYTYSKDGVLRKDYRDQLLAHLLDCLNAKTESNQVGYLGVLSQAPGFLFVDDVETSLRAISACCRPNKQTVLWGNARQRALSALTEVVKNIGLEADTISDSQLKSLYPVLIGSLADYTTDSRGDIGSIVREAGMQALLDFSSSLVKAGRLDVIDSDIMEQVFMQVARQAVEKIDRTRATACQVFVGLLHHEPQIPHIPHVEALMNIFTEEAVVDIPWRVAESTFPLFVQLLDFPDFYYQLVLGFAVSVGGVTENTVKASSAALHDYIVKHESDHDFIYGLMKTVGRAFTSLNEQPRVCLSLLKFLDFLLCDPVVASCMESHLPLVEQMVSSTWKHIRLSTEIPKLKASIDIYGAVLQFPDPVRFKAAQYLTQSLRHRYPIIRKTAASKLFECLLLYDVVAPESTEELSALLTETVWEQDLAELKPTRLRICELLGVPSTRPDSAASTE
uniref:Tubulin-specific chaperone D n=2 Tax=Mesocestoides corti TaxID=53468 RepID=A0A5K3F699_MESCO